MTANSMEAWEDSKNSYVQCENLGKDSTYGSKIIWYTKVMPSYVLPQSNLNGDSDATRM